MSAVPQTRTSPEATLPVARPDVGAATTSPTTPLRLTVLPGLAVARSASGSATSAGEDAGGGCLQDLQDAWPWHRLGSPPTW